MQAERVEVTNEAFSPRVLMSYLYTQGMTHPKGFRLEKREIYDYEIEFFLESEGGMLIDEIEYPVGKGDVVIRRPGQTTQGIMPYQCYLIAFDLLDNTGKRPENYNMCAPQQFQPNYRNPVLDVLPPVLHPPASEKYLGLFDQVLKEFITPGSASALLLKALVLQIIFNLYIDVKNPFTVEKIPGTPHYTAVKRSIDYLEEHYGQKITLQKLAGIANLSPTYFHHVFTATMGVTPNEFLNRIRMEKAKEYLVRTTFSVAEIALRCGYDNIPYFSYAFKKQNRIAPSDFRKKYTNISN